MTRRRLARVPWWAWLLIGWGAAAVIAAPFVGRWLRHAPEPRRLGLVDDAPRARSGPPYPHLEDTEPSLAGAILALAYSTDETAARYWLAQCARRGADWTLQRELWETWQAERARDVTTLHTDPEEPTP